jgi:TfoX/Sxy family transcriptional regulator of competence genes
VAFDQELAQRVREALEPERNVTSKQMFGGLAFMINGNMAVSASGQGGLLLRVDPADTERLVGPHADRFEMRGRPMDGWLRIDPAGLHTDEELDAWVAIGVRYAKSLPPKR